MPPHFVKVELGSMHPHYEACAEVRKRHGATSRFWRYLSGFPWRVPRALAQDRRADSVPKFLLLVGNLSLGRNRAPTDRIGQVLTSHGTRFTSHDPQYVIAPTTLSTSAISTITMASHGQPSRKHPSGPLLKHFLQPMHRMGSIWMRPNG